jgi:ATP adenylyltransferase
MQKLFSPWRSKYIETFSHPEENEAGCILCNAFKDNDDEKHLIIIRGETCYALLNKFPYNSGHIMVVPYRHTASFTTLTEQESLEIMSMLKRVSGALEKTSHPDGFNIGSNIGRTAGAGIDQHVHFHIVPRWNGDTNFMPILADTKMISEDMKETWRKIKQHF